MSLRTAAMTAALVLATSSMALAMAMGPVKVTLHPQNHSGQTGTATLTQDGANVVVVVDTENNPVDGPQPMHIHSGTCDTLGKVVYPLQNLVDGKSTTTIKNVQLSSLETGGFAINTHHSLKDIPTYYACGNIPMMKM